MKMKQLFLPATVLATALSVCSCSSDGTMPDITPGAENLLTFKISMPSGSKVTYTRDGEIHDASEYTINTLALYEYEVAGDNSEKLVRVIKSDGLGKNVLDLSNVNPDKSYTISITVPSENIGKDYVYRFVANDRTTDPAVGTLFNDGEDGFYSTKAARLIGEGATADLLASGGIAMTGVASDGTDNIITIGEEESYSVRMERIVSRIDISYQTPNLKVTSVELRNAPVFGYLFAQDQIPAHASADCLTLGMNTSTLLPDEYLKNMEETEVSLEKAFYLYERRNSADEGSATVHIEYEVEANDKTYHGAVDVDFSTAKGYIDTRRNHLYRIILGNGTEPVSGELKATLVVADWADVAIDDVLTSDDPEIN